MYTLNSLNVSSIYLEIVHRANYLYRMLFVIQSDLNLLAKNVGNKLFIQKQRYINALIKCVKRELRLFETLHSIYLNGEEQTYIALIICHVKKTYSMI